ncbi:MAG: hypothetical protein SFY69_07140 [Planctomycetota bacterium]|nr:hypothetical protein [Planctomycetota bacterium]
MQAGGASSGRRFRCVVLHPRRRPPRPELIAALTRPNFRVFSCEDEFGAMAHLCARAGEIAPRAGESTILLLVEPHDLEHPVELIEALDQYVPGASVWVFDSRSTHRLRAVGPEDLTTWRVERDEAPQAARPVTTPPAGAEARERRGPSPIPEPTMTIAGPHLRLAGEGAPLPEPTPSTGGAYAPGAPDPRPDIKPLSPGPAVPAPPASPAFPAVPARPSRASPTLLSDEELAMLLSGEAEKRT